MRNQLSALAIAAAVAAFGIIGSASAAGVAGSPQVPANWPGSSWDATPQAELTYLKQVCPTVQSHPAGYSATLDRFCAEVR